ncbi:MAG: Asp-tRNA(Asn)/Glu-tRNA(Gln) amidotransferase GatCAB subunit B, partial [Acidimicrobiia bacterium]
VAADRDLAQVSDEGELSSIVDQLVRDNPEVVDQYRAADDDKTRGNKVQALMGLGMKVTKGQANPKVLRDLIQARLDT